MGISVGALLVALPALAQGPGRQDRARHCNLATEVRETGTVEDVQQVGGYRDWSGTHILLKTDKEDLDMHLGPTAFVTQSGFTFAKGDRIEVLGSRVRVGARGALRVKGMVDRMDLAREVQKDGKTLVLRDANGIPKSSLARRGM